MSVIGRTCSDVSERKDLQGCQCAESLAVMSVMSVSGKTRSGVSEQARKLTEMSESARKVS